eukprot:GEMP01012190.1.p1 GENE.GEMP01012190.1~~GEMP01012190.1.p1  ORF type:complete len:885 (+),score=136.57 GEMP01012190.1:145-2799(+)
MSALCPILNAVIIVFTFDGGVHFASQNGNIIHNVTIDPLVVRTNKNMIPSLNDASDPLSLFYVEGDNIVPVEYDLLADAKPSEGLYIYHDHMFIAKDSRVLKERQTYRWVFSFLPMGSIEVGVETKSVTSVRTTDWNVEFSVSVSDVHMLSSQGPASALAQSLFIGHDHISTEDWIIPFSSPIRSVFTQTTAGTQEVVGPSTTWTVFCESNTCSPVVFPEEALRQKEILVRDSTLKHAFPVTTRNSVWGVLENPVIRYDEDFNNWPRLPLPRKEPFGGKLIFIKRGWRKRHFCLAGVTVVMVLWLLWTVITMRNTRPLHFFYSSPLVNESYNRMLPLEVDKEMERLYAVPSVASLEQIRHTAAAGGFIHLSCHTSGTQLIFEDLGVSQQVSQEQVVEALDGACFVFLAACNTWSIVEQLSNSVAFAIGTNGVVKDKDIRIFSHCFYQELYAHGTIENSFRRAQLLVSCDTSPFHLRALGPFRTFCGRFGYKNILGALGASAIVVPRMRKSSLRSALDFGIDDVIGREKDMVRLALLFRQRRVIAITGYGAFVFAKEFVRYFSLPGRSIPNITFLRSNTPELDASTNGGMLLLEPNVEMHVLIWLVTNWPPWPDCRVLAVGNAVEAIEALETQLPCKVARMELLALPAEPSAVLFLRRVHRPLHTKDFPPSFQHSDISLTERLLAHPIVGPVLRRGDPELIIRLAQRVCSSLRSLFDLHDEAAALLDSTRTAGSVHADIASRPTDSFSVGPGLGIARSAESNVSTAATDGADARAKPSTLGVGGNLGSLPSLTRGSSASSGHQGIFTRRTRTGNVGGTWLPDLARSSSAGDTYALHGIGLIRPRSIQEGLDTPELTLTSSAGSAAQGNGGPNTAQPLTLSRSRTD